MSLSLSHHLFIPLTVISSISSFFSFITYQPSPFPLSLPFLVFAALLLLIVSSCLSDLTYLLYHFSPPLSNSLSNSFVYLLYPTLLSLSLLTSSFPSALCTRHIGDWLPLDPHRFYKDDYLKYVGWMCFDYSAAVRKEAVRSVGKLLKVRLLFFSCLPARPPPLILFVHAYAWTHSHFLSLENARSLLTLSRSCTHLLFFSLFHTLSHTHTHTHTHTLSSHVDKENKSVKRETKDVRTFKLRNIRSKSSVRIYRTRKILSFRYNSV